MKNNYLLIGKITRAHGLKGRVIFLPLEWIHDFMPREKGTFFYQKTPGDYHSLQINEAQSYKKGWLIAFAQWTNFNEVEKLKNLDLYVVKKDFKIFSNLWYWPHLMNYELEYDGLSCGKIIDFFHTPAHLVGEIMLPDKRKYLLPLIEQYLKCLKESERKIIVKESVLELKNTLLDEETN